MKAFCIRNAIIFQKTDFVIVVSGQTGVFLALAMAQHGNSVIVLDSVVYGLGASTLNGGI